MTTSRGDVHTGRSRAKPRESGATMQLPHVGRHTVKLSAMCVKRYGRALEHWASNTPEVQVMQHQLIPKAAKWLREGGCIPPEDLKEISLNSTHIRMLMTAEVKRHGSPKVGTHWLLSDDMQDLLTRMIGIVQATVAECMEEVPPRQHCQARPGRAMHVCHPHGLGGGTVCLLITMNKRNSIRSPSLRRTTLTGGRVKRADKMQN